MQGRHLANSPSTAMTIRIADDLAGLIGDYDAVLCDLWGCVHDGRKPYPGALDCLRRIRGDGRTVLFLSNAPRPDWAVRRQLGGFGVASDCYDHVISSGDATIEALNRRDDPWHAALGRRYYHLGPERSLGLMQALDGETVPFEEAEVIVNTGLVDDDIETVEDYQPFLRHALARGLPMVCANPDLVVMRGDRTIYCAGALAEAYEAMGGEVRRHGKPYESVFRMAFERLGAPDLSRLLMVGDGFLTDIAGAANVGIDSLWIAAGIHGPEVGYVPGRPLEPERVRAACAAAGQYPTWAAPALIW